MELRCSRTHTRSGRLNDHALTRGQADRHFKPAGESFIHGLPRTGATWKTVVIENHDASRAKTRINEIDGITDTLIKVYINMCPADLFYVYIFEGRGDESGMNLHEGKVA